jgi:hypothetical protein
MDFELAVTHLPAGFPEQKSDWHFESESQVAHSAPLATHSFFPIPSVPTAQ